MPADELERWDFTVEWTDPVQERVVPLVLRAHADGDVELVRERREFESRVRRYNDRLR